MRYVSTGALLLACRVFGHECVDETCTGFPETAPAGSQLIQMISKASNLKKKNDPSSLWTNCFDSIDTEHEIKIAFQVDIHAKDYKELLTTAVPNVLSKIEAETYKKFLNIKFRYVGHPVSPPEGDSYMKEATCDEKSDAILEKMMQSRQKSLDAGSSSTGKDGSSSFGRPRPTPSPPTPRASPNPTSPPTDEKPVDSDPGIVVLMTGCDRGADSTLTAMDGFCSATSNTIISVPEILKADKTIDEELFKTQLVASLHRLISGLKATGNGEYYTTKDEDLCNGLKEYGVCLLPMSKNDAGSSR
jgi:hypothetical protein